MIFHALYDNVVLLFVLGFFMSRMAEKMHERSRYTSCLAGLAFGIVSVLSMYNTFQLETGIVFDARSVILSVGGLIYGLPAALVASVIAVAYRLYQGGAGVYMGILVILSSAMIGVLFNWWSRCQGLRPGFLFLGFMGLAVHLVMLLLVFILPQEHIYPTLQAIFIPVITLFPAATALIGWIFLNQQTRMAEKMQVIRNEERFRNYFKSAPFGICQLNLHDLSIETANPMFHSIFGLKLNQLKKYRLDALIAPLNKDLTYHDMFQTDRSRHDILIQTSSGEKKYGILNTSRISYHSSICFFEDVTAIREAERKQNEKDELIKLAFLGTMDGLWDWDRTTNRITLDEMFFKMLDLEEAQREYNMKWFLEWLHPRDREKFRTALKSCYLEEQPLFDIEYRIRKKDGSWSWIWANGKATRWDRDGHPIRISGTHRDITQRKNLEKEIRRKEERLKMAQEAARIGTWEHDKSSNKVFWSKITEEIFGYKENSFPRTLEGYLQSIHPEDKDRVLNQISQTGENGQEVELEFRIIRKDGVERWVHSHGKEINDGEEGSRVLGVVQDITEKKRGDIKLLESEKTFKALYDNSMDGIIQSTPDHKYIQSNKAFQELTGYTHEELLGSTWHRLTPEEWHPVQNEIYRNKLYRTGRSGIFEKEYRHKSGAILSIQMTSSMEYDEAGNPKSIWSVIRDITKLKKADESFRESEARFRTMVESAPIGIFLTDNQGEPIYINAEERKMLGLAKKEFTLKNWVEYLHPDDRDKISKKYLDAIKLGKKCNITSRYLRKDGKVVWFTAKFAPVVVDGKVIAHTGMVMDITRQKETEIKLKEHRKELESKIAERTSELSQKKNNLEDTQKALTFLLEDMNDARLDLERSNRMLKTAIQELEAFSYSVSHDLRAPLRSINGFSYALLEDYGRQIDDTGKDFLQRINQASMRMGDLIEDLLRLSRISRADIYPEKINISNLGREIGDHLKESNPERKIKFEIEPDIVINSDQRLVRIVMENIIGNAWKFTGKNPDPVIRIGRANSGDQKDATTFYVKDNGTGFDMKYEAEMYNPFKRLHKQNEFEGSGIGLATVKRIMNRLQGETRAESVPDQGATFYLTFKKGAS